MVCLAFLLSAGLLAVPDIELLTQASQTVSLESIRAAHQARAAAIQTLVVDEHSVTRRRISETHEDSVFNRMQGRVVRAEQRARESAVCEPTTPEEMAAFEERVREAGKENFPEEIRSVLLANRMMLTDDHSVYDFQSSRYCCKRNDVRDLKKLAVEYGLPEHQMRNLTASGATVGCAVYSASVDEAGTSGALVRGSGALLIERLELLGIAPQRLLDWKRPTTVAFDQEGQIVLRGDGMDGSGPAFEMTLKNKPGYPMVHLTQYKPDGTVTLDLTLSDARVIADGIAVPFQSVLTRQLGDMGEQTTVRKVTSIELNQPVPLDLFRVNPRAALLCADVEMQRAFDADQEALRK